ncbi:MAG: glycosyltransferase [Chthoniobacteraceae bacterium]
MSNARDTGLRHATGDLFIFLDDDCYLGEHYLFYAVQAFAKGEFDYAGGRIENYDETDALYGSNTRQEYGFVPAHSFIRVGTFQGTNFVMTRKLYQKVVGITRMFGTSKGFRCEDIDYCARASVAGFAGAHLPQLVVFHHHGRKPGESRNNLHKANAIAAGGYYLKNILSCCFNYFTGWMKTFSKNHKKEFCWQVFGALKYFAVLSQKVFERTIGTAIHRVIHPRKFHAFCIGTNKSGTHSINEIFQASTAR